MKTIHNIQNVVYEVAKSWNWENFDQRSKIGVIHSQISPSFGLDSFKSKHSAVREMKAQDIDSSRSHQISSTTSSSIVSTHPSKFKDISQLYKET